MQVIVVLAVSLFGTTYYVAPNGSDGGPGTLGNPWKTIQHAAVTLPAGDTVLVRAGTYNEHVQPANSGNPTEGPIVYAAYPGEKPVIDGAGLGINNGFVLDHLSYVKLLGLEVKNWNDAGILVDGSDHLEIADCEIHECGGCIQMLNGAHDFELNRVRMHHFTMLGFDASPAGGDPCYNGVFNDCVAYSGRDPGQNVDGMALGHGSQHDFVFNRCRVYDIFDGFDLSSRNTTLNRCASYNCWNAGYKLWQHGITLVNCLSYHQSNACIYVAWSGTGKQVALQNCTFVDGGTYTVWVENTQDTLNMYNCILAGGDNIGLAFEQMGVNNYHGDYNVFHNDNVDRAIAVGYTDEFPLDSVASGAWTRYSGEDAHSLVATDPATQLFENLGAWDLHLRAGSIAINTGTSQGAPAEDYDGHPRPNGPGYDIGAYEWGPPGIGSDRPVADDPGTALAVSPNPVRARTVIRCLVPVAGRVVLQVFDASGRLVRTLLDETAREPGSRSATWDCRAGNGQRVGAGVYFCRLAGSDFRADAKLVVMR